MSQLKRPLVQSTLLFGGLLFYILFMNTALVVWLRDNHLSLSLVQSIIIRQVLSFGLPLGAYLAWKKLNLSDVVQLAPLSAKQTLLVVLITLTALPVGMFVSGVTSLFFDNTAAQLLVPAAGRYELWWLLVAMAFTPALLEELLFRGVLHHLLTGLSVSVIVVISGLFFGLVHLNIQQFSYAFLLGMLFSVMVQYTGSVWSGVLAHLLVNGLNVVLVYLQARGLALASESELAQQLTPTAESLGPLLVVGVIALLALPCLQWLLARLKVA